MTSLRLNERILLVKKCSRLIVNSTCYHLKICIFRIVSYIIKLFFRNNLVKICDNCTLA